MSACHLIAFRNLTFLNDIDLDDFRDTRTQFVAFRTFEDSDGLNDTGTAVRNSE